MKQCQYFGLCGGCKFDFGDALYKKQKLDLIKSIPDVGDIIWLSGKRRRAEFAFVGNKFGFFQGGSKNIIEINHCPNLTDKLNEFLPMMSSLPWTGSGSVLITECDNGIDIAINSSVPYFGTEFKDAISKLPAVRITWNDKVIIMREMPIVSLGDRRTEYPSNAFLQPSVMGEETLRDLVVAAATGYKKIVDLFCGIGTFTYATNATGFDVVGPFINRDLFKKPLTAKNLNQFDCVIVDPPRAGLGKQGADISKSDVGKIIYVSCNPITFMNDRAVLERGGYKLTKLTAIDQFIGTSHWELFAVFEK